MLSTDLEIDELQNQRADIDRNLMIFVKSLYDSIKNMNLEILDNLMTHTIGNLFDLA